MHIDSVFVYLRRLADRFAGAVRMLLFADHGEASTQFKNLRESVLDSNALRRYRLVCNQVLLQTAFADHCKWFDELRNQGTFVGIRDRMEHHNTQTLIGGYRANGGPLVHTAYLTLPAGGVEANRELFGTLRWMLIDVCEFFAAIHSAVGYGTRYERGDGLVLFGADEDVTGWWPEL
jgi:hypothetical protein